MFVDTAVTSHSSPMVGVFENPGETTATPFAHDEIVETCPTFKPDVNCSVPPLKYPAAFVKAVYITFCVDPLSAEAAKAFVAPA